MPRYSRVLSQPEMQVDNDYLLLQHWSATPVELKVIMTNQPPTSVLGFHAEKKTLVMQLPTLIKRPCIPKDNDLSHSPTIFCEKHEIALLGFINLGLNEQEACDFPEDFLRYWLTHVSPTTAAYHVERTPPFLETLLVECTTILEPITG